MPNEFVARNGLISQNNSVVTGSLVVTQGITGSLAGTASNAISSSFASTASLAPAYVLNSTTASMLQPYVLTSSTASMTVSSSSFATTASFISPTFISASAAASGFASVKLYRKVTADNSVTNTLTRTVLSSILIPANTVSVGDTIYILARNKRTGNNSAMTPNIHINTTATATGNRIYNITQAAANNTVYLNKFGIVKSATVTEVGQEGISNDIGVGAVNTSVTTYNVDWTVDQYIVFSVALGNTADTSTLSLLVVEIK